MSNQPDRIPREQIGKIENANWRETFRSTAADGRTHIDFRSDLKLEDIPLSDEVCIGCHEGSHQREIVEWKVESEHLIVDAVNMPGYGCTACTAKSGYVPVVDGFHKAAFELLSQAGDVDDQGRIKEFQRSV